ncbi:MAG: cardiolipin synthase [Rhodospirillales bacterium]|nr:cardiolipin synthase [Rhodospirillales bacterium]
MDPATKLLSTLSLLGLAVLVISTSGIAAAHAILHKTDVRAAIGWVGLACLVPLVGPLLYGILGINRIRRRAIELRPQRAHPLPRGGGPPRSEGQPIVRPVADVVAGAGQHLAPVISLVDAVSPSSLTEGNAITPLWDGETAYAEMVAAINGARRSLALASYIFDNDRGGRMFCDALAAAVGRGVQVRVLIDGVGARYSYPPITPTLRRLGIPVREFLPSFLPLQLPYANLRNHRKILVVDGRIGFTGGMNIRSLYLRSQGGGHQINDVHFRLEGPVVRQLAEVFADDWAFTTNEVLAGTDWFPILSPAGNGAARAIASGPDEDVERIRWTIMAALSHARRQVSIVTPYFLPDSMLMTSLVMAAMRGVAVEIFLPQKNNLRLVQWASKAKLGLLLAQGCRVWETPPPFDHCKIMTVDGIWCLIGSANWDERSLRLNFELNVECYDPHLAPSLDALIEAKRSAGREVTHKAVETRSLPVKLRDGAAWLLSPYL